MERKSNHFSGQLGFVLAAAGSAVGVGNLWRFPYLAAKDGGGLFLIIYFILVLTFGFTLLTSDIAIGRRTQKSAIGAYAEMKPKWKFLGILTFLVPVLIMTYYAVIGGWITKYAVVYLTGQANAAAADDYFTSFITSSTSPVIFALIFMGVTAFIVYNGVQDGIEKVSKWMMPVLLVLVVIISIYSLTLKHTDSSGQVHTGIQGFLYYLNPNLEELLKYLKMRGFKIGLASSTREALVRSEISDGGLLGYFDQIIGGDMVERSKPEPDIFLEACRRLGTRPENCYVIDEMERNGSRFRRKKLYRIMIRYVAPVMMFILFLQSTGVLS